VAGGASARRAARFSASPPMRRSNVPTTAHSARRRKLAERLVPSTRLSLTNTLRPPEAGSTQWAKRTFEVPGSSHARNASALSSAG
jgi:hypothetical protein